MLYGAVPGRMQEGDTPPTQLGGMGERCKLPQTQKPILFAFMNNTKKWRPRKRPRA